MKIEGAFEAETLGVLRSIPEVETLASEHLDGGTRADAMIHSAGAAHPVAIEFKRHVNTATAHRLATLAARLPADVGLVVVAGSTTAEARRLLEDDGIGVIDGLGNVHVELPGLLLHLEPRRTGHVRETATAPPTRLAGKAEVVTQALLLEPRRMWTVSELAERAMVSTGLAHRVLTRLEREGTVASDGAGPHRTRQVRDPAALLDLWTEEATDRRVQRSRAFRLSRDPSNVAGSVSHAFTAAGIDHAVTNNCSNGWMNNCWRRPQWQPKPASF
jgi:hypothetical protein